jgi:hypothetical protein
MKPGLDNTQIIGLEVSQIVISNSTENSRSLNPKGESKGFHALIGYKT